MIEYDYKNQAWTKDGLYVRCAHAETMDCKCYGKLHEGEQYNSRHFRYAMEGLQGARRYHGIRT